MTRAFDPPAKVGVRDSSNLGVKVKILGLEQFLGGVVS